MKFLIMFLILTLALGVGLFVAFLIDLKKAKKGEKSLFWVKDETPKGD